MAKAGAKVTRSDGKKAARPTLLPCASVFPSVRLRLPKACHGGSTASGQEQEKCRHQVSGSMISARFDKENLRNSLPHRFMYELMIATRKLGYYPNLLSPSTFNEKVICRKLFAARPIYRTVADKHAVRDYVSQKIGKKYLVPMYEVIDRPDQISFNHLPERFFMQPNNASGTLFSAANKWSLDPKTISNFVINY
ncbi:MAG: hypothetical protein GVY13_09520 [Alphaproteobacteria bacterium]|jgi:hypothetical protein|nr:hypothetical protein [Alphaproteobacteria bacterium]